MPLPTPSTANVPSEQLGVGVDALTSTYDVRRQQSDPSDSGSYGEAREDTYQSIGDRQLYLYTTSVTTDDTPAGEQTEQALSGMARVSTDVQADDRVTYGSYVYEFDEPVPRPDSDPVVVELTATRV